MSGALHAITGVAVDNCLTITNHREFVAGVLEGFRTAGWENLGDLRSDVFILGQLIGGYEEADREDVLSREEFEVVARDAHSQMVERGFDPAETFTAMKEAAEDGFENSFTIDDAEASDHLPELIALEDVTRKVVRHLDDGRLMEGKMTMMAGDPGSKKSWVSLAIAARITCGLPVFPEDLSPGAHEAEPGNILALIGEDGLSDTVKGRFEDLGGDGSRFFALQYIDAFDADDEPVKRRAGLHDVDVIERLFKKLRPKLMIVDPLQAFVRRLDMNSLTQVRSALGPLVHLAERYGVALLIISHMNKGDNKALHRINGSVDLAAAPRSVLIVGTYKGKCAVAHAKASLSSLAPTLTFEISETVPGQPRLEWTGTIAATADDITQDVVTSARGAERSDEAEDFLLQVLSDGPVPVNEIKEQAKAAGVSWTTVRRTQEAMGIKPKKVTTSGAARGSGFWQWALPQEDTV